MELARKEDEFQADIQDELLRIKSALESSTKPKELPTCKPPSSTYTCTSKLSGADGSENPGSKLLSDCTDYYSICRFHNIVWWWYCQCCNVGEWLENATPTSIRREEHLRGLPHTIFTVGRAVRLDGATEGCLPRHQPKRIGSDCADKTPRRTAQRLHCIVCCFAEPLTELNRTQLRGRTNIQRRHYLS